MTKIGYKAVSHLEAENLLCNVLKGKTFQEQSMIDYNLLNESLEYYNSNGFTRIESPWSVAKEIDDITRPEEKIPFQLKHNNKCLVASGEQSFLYLYLKGFLPLGKFQTITPCFRSDDFDLLHTKYFMKNELIITDEVNEEQLEFITETALCFFQKYLKDSKIVKTDIGYDIMYDNIELGSYGIRECSFLRWVYGTGCAEPRLSTAIHKYNLFK